MFTGSVSRSTPIRFLNFNVKIFNPVMKKEFETYVLIEVKKDSIAAPALLRKELTESMFLQSLILQLARFSVY